MPCPCSMRVLCSELETAPSMRDFMRAKHTSPFVAGAIHVRNQIRALKQREKARKRKALAQRIPVLRVTLLRYSSSQRTFGPRRTGISGQRTSFKSPRI